MIAFWKWVGGILAAVIVGLILALFVDPLKHMVGPERVSATVETIPWYPHGRVTSSTPIPGWRNLSLGDFRRIIKTEPDMMRGKTAARIIVTNDTGSELKGARVDFRQIGSAVDVAIFSETEPDVFVADAKYVDVPPLGPGDHQTLYIWSGFDLGSESIRHIRVFTPRGMLKLKGGADFSSEFQTEPEIDVERIFFRTLVTLVALLMVLLLFGAFAGEWYYKKLLGDPKYYRLESARYRADPKKFAPKTPKDAAAAALDSKAGNPG